MDNEKITNYGEDDKKKDTLLLQRFYIKHFKLNLDYCNYVHCKLKVALFIVIAASGMALLGCKKEGLINQGSSIGNDREIHFDGQQANRDSLHLESGRNSDRAIVLGNIVDDPYKLKNMQAAYDNINDGTAPITTIKANYRYVRILPTNKEQLQAIESDTTLVLFDYPLHYEILVYGTYYHDPVSGRCRPNMALLRSSIRLPFSIRHQRGTDLSCVHSAHFGKRRLLRPFGRRSLPCCRMR